jgi:hypothetical protein
VSTNGTASLISNTPTDSPNPTSLSLAVQLEFSRRWGGSPCRLYQSGNRR